VENLLAMKLISSYKCAVKGSPYITLICFKHFSYWLFSFTDSCTACFRSSTSSKKSYKKSKNIHLKVSFKDILSKS